MNCVNLIGRLTKDPEIRNTTTSNIPVASFSVAVNRAFVKEGEERQADFINIVAWNKTAEFVQKYFKKGQQVGITGRIQTRTWDDENNVKHYVTEVVAEKVFFADSKRETGATPNEVPQQNASVPNEFDQATHLLASQDDLPF